MIIAIDGEAASGKGTLSKLLAKHLNFAYLDTGLLYRAIAYLTVVNNVNTNDYEEVARLSNKIDEQILLNPILKSNDIANIASIVAQIGGVRTALLKFQQDFAKNYSQKGFLGAILDGRDIGTHVIPNADIKFYITASLDERAKRRFLELETNIDNLSENPKYIEYLNSLKARDDADKNRTHNPLKPAEDSIIIDTTTMNVEESLSLLLRLLKEKLSL